MEVVVREVRERLVSGLMTKRSGGRKSKGAINLANGRKALGS
jgi:hypothetical protein